MPNSYCSKLIHNEVSYDVVNIVLVYFFTFCNQSLTYFGSQAHQPIKGMIVVMKRQSEVWSEVVLIIYDLGHAFLSPHCERQRKKEVNISDMNVS